ncbi:MAG: hypothetical protein IIU35_04475 [Neisseriaceae bacterium]|nr:hypothetical protein [Neisseriaceae bacterium]
MMKKIVFSLLLCSSLLGLSACESKEEKRTQLKAQIEALETQQDRCFRDKKTAYLSNDSIGINATMQAAKECKEEYIPQLTPLYEELDKLNGVK